MTSAHVHDSRSSTYLRIRVNSRLWVTSTCLARKSLSSARARFSDCFLTGLARIRQQGWHEVLLTSRYGPLRWFWFELRANSYRRAISRFVLRLDRVELVRPIGRLHAIRAR